MRGVTTRQSEGEDFALAALVDAVSAAKAGDPLAPITVIAPSPYAAAHVRRALATARVAGPGVGSANLTCTTVGGLMRTLGLGDLASRGQRLAPVAVDLEAIRSTAAAQAGWPNRLCTHTGALGALHAAFADLRRCPSRTLDAMARQPGRVGELVTLFNATRVHLHEHGFADELDLIAAAGAAARGGGAEAALGPLVRWQLGPVGPLAESVLADLGVLSCDVDGRGRAPTHFSEVWTCTDPDEEARRAVRTVISNAEAGVPLWRQAMFHPAGTPYARVLHEQLAAAGVAANGPAGHRLDRSMTAIALLGLLALAGGDWPRDQVMAWLSSGPITAGPGGRPVPASRWDAVSAEAGVVKGAPQWRTRLDNVATSGGWRGDEARALADFIDGLLSRARVPGTSWEALARWSIDLLDHYVTPNDGDWWPAEEIAAAEQVRGVVLAFAELDQVSTGADLLSFRRALQSQLEATDLDSHELPGGGYGDGVFVAPFALARGLHFDSVVLSGLADSFVPGAMGEDVLVPDEARRLDGSGALRRRAQRLEDVHDNVTAALGGRRANPHRHLAARRAPHGPRPVPVAVAGGAGGLGHGMARRGLFYLCLGWARSGAVGPRAPTARPHPMGPRRSRSR